MRPRPGQRGFTLLELLVALFIVVVLGYVTVTNLPGKQASSVKGTVSDLHGALLTAQSLARSSGRTVVVRTSGGGPNAPVLEWGFQDIAGDVQGTWRQPPNAFGAASVGIGNGDMATANPIPNPTTVPAITPGYIPLVAWNNQLFTGSVAATQAITFDGAGRASGNFFVTVSGRRGGTVYSGCPMAVIVAGPTTGIAAFYKPGVGEGNAAWQRL